jgi:hypothetical protein
MSLETAEVELKVFVAVLFSLQNAVAGQSVGLFLFVGQFLRTFLVVACPRCGFGFFESPGSKTE